MNYFGIYKLLIDRAKVRSTVGFFELHHILPKCLGGSDDLENLIRLTPREHQFAHKLLVKMHPGNPRIAFAANMMYSNSRSLSRSGLSPNWVRKEVSEMRRRDWGDPAKRAEMCDAMKVAWRNEQRKLANSKRMKSYWSDPEMRRANSEKLKAYWLRSKLLPESAIEEAAALKSEGFTWSELAERYSVKRTTIRRYVQQRLTVSD